MNKDEVRLRAEAALGESSAPLEYFFAPGRVNIIGEHQDYNGGHVFPAALTVGIYGAIRRRPDRKVRLYSKNMGTLVEIDLDSPMKYEENWDWANYPIGIIDYLVRSGQELPGMDLYFEGDLPSGAGLSSSACILDLTGFMIWSLLGIPVDRTALAEMAQQVEYNFIGVKVGIMDQFAISQGKAGHGVLLDCTAMKFELIPVTWDGCELIIMNTNKRRGLVDSKFNERKEECDQALAAIRRHRPISGLSLAEESDLEYIDNEIWRRRAKHALTENKRVLRFIEALRRSDLTELAEILNESHTSLKYDYEVSGRELDTIVELARKQEGCLASRMTGAGFGGCAIALVRKEQVPEFMKQVSEKYNELIGTEPDMYHAVIGDGVHRLTV